MESTVHFLDTRCHEVSQDVTKAHKGTQRFTEILPQIEVRATISQELVLRHFPLTRFHKLGCLFLRINFEAYPVPAPPTLQERGSILTGTPRPLARDPQPPVLKPRDEPPRCSLSVGELSNAIPVEDFFHPFANQKGVVVTEDCHGCPVQAVPVPAFLRKLRPVGLKDASSHNIPQDSTAEKSLIRPCPALQRSGTGAAEPAQAEVIPSLYPARDPPLYLCRSLPLFGRNA
jgi:hypothetical protein